MPATITTTLKDNSKEWVDALKKRFAEGGGAAEDFENVLEGVNKELASREAKRQAEAVKDLADRLDGTTAAAARLKREEQEAADAMGRAHWEVIRNSRALKELDNAAYAAAERAGTLAAYNRDLESALNEIKVRKYREEIDALAMSMSGMAKETAKPQNDQFWVKTAAKFNLAREAFSWVKAGFTAVGSYAQEMAEKGNAAFAKLISVSSKFRNALYDIGNSREVSDLIHRLSQEIEASTPKVKDWFGSALGVAHGVIDYSMKGYLKLFERIGLVHQGTMQALAEEQRAHEEMSKKRHEDLKKALKYQEDLIALQKKEAAAAILNPGGKMYEDAFVKEAIKDYKTVAEVTASITRLKKQQQQAVDAAKKQGRDPLQDRTVIEDGKELALLEARRLELMIQQKEVARTAKKEVPRQVNENEISQLDALISKYKSSSEQIKVLEARRESLVKKSSDKNASPEERQTAKNELEDLDKVIEKQKKKNDDIERAEKERERIVEKNRKLERDNAKDAADLDRINHEQHMARLKEKSDKEIEAKELAIETEKQLAEIRDQNNAEDRASHQKKVGQLKELLMLQGKPIPGAPGMNMPSVADRLKSMVKPQKVKSQVIKKRQETAVQKWKEKNKGRLDKDGNLIDVTGEFNNKSEKERKRILAARQRSQIGAAKQQARAGAQKDMNTGKLSNEEIVEAQGELLNGVSENLIKKGNLNESQVAAMRQVVDELTTQNRTAAQLQDQMNGIQRALATMRTPAGNKGGRF